MRKGAGLLLLAVFVVGASSQFAPMLRASLLPMQMPGQVPAVPMQAWAPWFGGVRMGMEMQGMVGSRPSAPSSLQPRVQVVHSKPVAPKDAKANNTRHSVDKNHTRDAEEIWPLDPWEYDPMDEVFGTIDPDVPDHRELTENEIAQLKVQQMMREKERKKRQPKVEDIRDTLKNVIREVNVYNKLQPHVQKVVMATPLGDMIVDSLNPKKGVEDDAPKDVRDAETTRDADGSSGFTKILEKLPFASILMDKLGSLDLQQMGPVRFSPENFRNIYWSYPLLASYFALQNPSVHNFGFLPWAFYFANMKTQVVSYDKAMVQGTLGMD